jgi:hypothetical protein
VSLLSSPRSKTAIVTWSRRCWAMVGHMYFLATLDTHQRVVTY